MSFNGIAGVQRVGLLVALGMVLGLLGLSTEAHAVTTINSFGYDGQQFGSGGAAFANPGQPVLNGLGLDPTTGDILISRNSDGEVRVYAPDSSVGGTDLTSFFPLGEVSAFPANLAVDPTSGAVYVDDDIIMRGAIYRYVTDRQATPTYTPDSSFAPQPGLSGSTGGLAVDPTTHDLLVVDTDAKRVFRLSSVDGSTLDSFNGSDANGGPFGTPEGIAVGPSGALYVADASRKVVDRFTSAGVWQGTVGLASGDSPQSVAVNPNTGDVVVLSERHGQSYVEGFSSTGVAKWEQRIWFDTDGYPLTGIAWNGALNRIYLGSVSGRVSTLVAATQPGVADPTIVSSDRDSASVSADVATGTDPTTAWIEYCPTASAAACDDYPVSDPSNPSNPWIRGPAHSNITGDHSIVDDLPLPPVSRWKLRTFASNGTAENRSVGVTVDTPAVAAETTTGPVGSITDAQAELTGTIDTLGAPTTYRFDYGLTTSYGSRVPAATEAPAGNNRTPRAVSKVVKGLQPGTVYHYRLVAHNSGGDGVGADRTFSTAGTDEVAPQRAYEQVTPVDKKGAQVNNVFHVQAATDGSAIAVATGAASQDAEGSRIFQNYVSRRGGSDWLGWQKVEAPQDARGGIFESSTAAISADFEHALVVSNRALAPGAIAGGGNIYIKDLRTGGYTFVAGAPGSGAYALLAGIQQNEQIYMAGAPDFSWILFWGQSFFLPEVGGSAIYRWSRADGLKIESRLPDDSVPPVGVQLPGSSRKTGTAASTDGRVVAFSAGGVYRRADGHTTAISVSRVAGDPLDPQPGTLDWVTPDGRYVVFHSPARLTDAAMSAVNGELEALYRYDAVTGQLEFIGNVTQFTDWDVYGVSDDGQTMYYDSGSEGTKVWQSGQERTVTAARPQTGGQESYVTANGRFLAWVDFTNRAQQAYRYDAQTDQTVCVSCLADGNPGKPAKLMWAGRTIGNRSKRVMTESGVVFFDTASRLVTADHNGTTDVYSYGVRPTLISPGDGAFNATFVDASDDGSNVFFQTDEALVSQDTDGNPDVYDARVGGGFPGQSPLPPAAPCVRAECGELGSGPVSSSPVSSSTTAGGAGVKRTNQAKVVVSVSRVSFGAKSVRVTFRASERGRVKVTGSRVATTVRNVAKAGSYSVSVPLSAKARALRRAHKKFKVSLKVSLSGGWGSASAKYSRTLGN